MKNAPISLKIADYCIPFKTNTLINLYPFKQEKKNDDQAIASLRGGFGLFDHVTLLMVEYW